MAGEIFGVKVFCVPGWKEPRFEVMSGVLMVGNGVVMLIYCCFFH